MRPDSPGVRRSTSALLPSARATCVGSCLLALVCAACSRPDSSELFSEFGAASPLPEVPMAAEADDMSSAVPVPAAIGQAPPSAEVPPPIVRAPGASDAGPTPPAADAGQNSGQGPDESGAPVVPVRPPVGVVVGDAAACTFPASPPADALLFSGVRQGNACRINLDEPYASFWYAYQDSDDGARVFQGVQSPGCAEDRCSLHVQGPIDGAAGFSVYGAGVGFPLAPGDAEFDASGFSGIQYWARGNIEGTRGPGNTSSPQTLLLKVASATNRAGDDFGRYCRIDTTSWTLCRQEFAELERDGYVASPSPASDTLELDRLVRIQFELPLHRDASGAAPLPVRFDIELAAISFF